MENIPSDSPVPKETPLWQAILPIAFLLFLVVYGLVILPRTTESAPLPLEIIFILASAFTIVQLLMTGHRWEDIQKSIVTKLKNALPAFFILFSIGLIIGSWMVCGTVPMLVYYGLKLIQPNLIYIVAFVCPILFSTMTGTSWGSVGTIGVVVIGIANAMDANLGIVAGAIVGGAYFGDKLSPLSDTTNMASLAADVKLYDHIHSMLFTTVPSALIAGAIYFSLGYVFTPEIATEADGTKLEPFLNSLSSRFVFSPLLLLPPAVVLVGSIARKPILPTIFASIFCACGLAWLIQPFSAADIVQTLHRGFDVTMTKNGENAMKETSVLLNRGGLYALHEPIITAFMVFIYIGALDHIRAMPTLVGKVLRFAQERWQVIIATLGTTAATIALTSNQFATSFIIGDAFKAKYDELKIKRKVLSRSLEDTGTMVETLVPWSLATIYMVETLGVPFRQYVGWQLLSIINVIVAVVFALTGIACFVEKNDSKSKSAKSEI